MTSVWPPACSGKQGLAVAGSECDSMDSDDRLEMSEVKIEIDVAEEPPILCKREKDDQGQWWAVPLVSYMLTIVLSKLTCTDDIKSWMCKDQLKLNEGKTEAVPFSPRSLLSSISFNCSPSSIAVGAHDVAFSDKVRNLGFILDSNVLMEQHVIKVCLLPLLCVPP